ncbi:hypothetical protein PR202_ga13408 [Eleusine coracana subsp. coracana]|uniref:Uncharacterized protein n=1 Tax=Eleusine coracana subsp. coracana TaxID=191504 RepID=A0AAV5CEL7_ELECO|nr:hypothetical protein PR202_ga13408 [Eleusine coracana subsp. coracana]
MFHSLTNSIVARAAFGKKRKNAAEFMAAIKAGVGLSSGFCIPDLFPTWTTVLAKVTGMKRSLQGIHNTVNSILQEIIDERKAIRDEIRSGAAPPGTSTRTSSTCSSPCRRKAASGSISTTAESRPSYL